MKFYNLIIVLILWKHVHGNNFFDTVATKFIEIKQAFSTTFDGAVKNVKDFFKTLPVDIPRVKHEAEAKLQNVLSKFVIKTTFDLEQDSDDEITKLGQTKLMTTPDLASIQGKTIESHIVQTTDGYLLTLHHIVRRNPSVKATANKTVLLHHGLLGSSADWILLGPEKSLPYILSNAGYDVWMANARGNYYSRSHITLTINSSQFWTFSWQEMGEYDLPAVIDYIRNQKAELNEISYIGHSMGATALMVLLSTTPRYNQYIKIAILLAPIVYMDNIQGPFRKLTKVLSNPFGKLFKNIGNTEFLPSRKIPEIISKKFCKVSTRYCSNPLLFATGGFSEDEKYNASFVARLMHHVPAGGSTNTILHYAELKQSGKFRRFQQLDAEFPLEQVTTPLVLFCSDNDWLAPASDVLKLYLSVENPVDYYVIHGKNLTHTEFVWGSEADVLVFPKIMDYLKSELIQELHIENNSVFFI